MSRTRRYYSGNFQSGDQFWTNLPGLRRSETEHEVFVTVVRRYTLRIPSDALPTLYVDLQRTGDASPYSTTYAELQQSSLVHNYLDPPGDAPWLAEGQQTIPQTEPTDRVRYTGAFRQGDMFWTNLPGPRSAGSSEVLVRVLNRYDQPQGDSMIVNHIHLQREYDRTDYHTTFGALMAPNVNNYLDPPGRASWMSEGFQQPEEVDTVAETPPTRRRYTGNFARGDQFWIVPRSPHTIFPRSNESALVLRRDGGFVRLEHPGWEALSITIDELLREATLFIDPPIGDHVAPAEHIDLEFDFHVPIGQAAPLPTTPPPDNHRVVTLRR